MSQEMAVMKSKIEDLKIEMGEKLFPVVKALFDALSWIIDNIVKPFIIGLEQIWGGLKKIGAIITGVLIAAWNALKGALETVWKFLKPIVDAVKWLIDNLGKVGGKIKNAFGGIGGGIKKFFGFQTGTGLAGLPTTGPFVGHEKEIVLNRKDSDIFREMSRGVETPASATGTGDGTNINIGEINITANSEEEGRSAAKGVLMEIESAYIRGDKEAF
jgi:Flp pilus assembly pilin Flp